MRTRYEYKRNLYFSYNVLVNLNLYWAVNSIKFVTLHNTLDNINYTDDHMRNWWNIICTLLVVKYTP